jgi:hypothetical protein
VLPRLRRFAAVLLGVLALQLSLLGTRAACATTVVSGTAAAADDPAGAPASHGDGEQGHHGAAPAAPASGGDASSGGHDADHGGEHDGRMHCPTGMACATIGVAGDAAALPATARRPVVRVASLDATAPAPVASAPEPPPPRA